MLAGCSDTAKNNVSITVSDWVLQDGTSDRDLNYFYEKYDSDKYNIVVNDWEYDVEAFLMRAAIGQLPTIYEAYFTDIERIKNSGYGTDITDYLADKGYIDMLDDNVRELVSKDGRIYAIPAKGYVLGMIFNAELFEQAGLKEADGSYKFPKTMEELVTAAQVIKEKTGAAGFLIPADGNTGGWIFTNIAWENGVEFIKKDEQGLWKAAFDTPECAETLQWVKDLKWKYDILPANPFTNQKQSWALLAAGQCAMLIDHPGSAINHMIEDYGIDKDDVGAFTIPAGRKGNIALMGGNIFGINNSATDEQLDAALKLLEATVLPEQELSDDLKSRIEQKYVDMTEENFPIGIKSVDIWGDTAETRYRDELIEKYKNVDKSLYEDFNECLTSDNVEIRLEEPVCCQDLYRILTECIQEVLKNENANSAELIHNASLEFQSEYLDKIN